GVRSTIERVAAKLEGKHWMFKDSAKRLELIRMCEDCRIAAVTEENFDPYGVPARPAPRTTEDYLREREGKPAGWAAPPRSLRGDGMPDDDVSEDSEAPKLWLVLMFNDDATPMAFVEHLLQQVFQRNEEEANRIMLDTHHHGIAVCAVYDRHEDAEAK